MRKFVLYVAALAVTVASCGGTATSPTASSGGGETAPTEPAVSDTEAADAAASETPRPTSGAGERPETDPPTARPSFDGPPAPDFELALESGGSIRPSAEPKPIYMIFWAEW